jgi:hypothetical protein
MWVGIFFYKEHILISRRYRLHPVSATIQCPSDNMDAKKKNYKKKSLDQFPVAAALTP